MLIESSRCLTGPSRHFTEMAVVLDSEPEQPLPEALYLLWQQRVRRMCLALFWPEPRFDILRYRNGVALAFTAPLDQLFSASDLNDWAFLSALGALQKDPTATQCFELEAHIVAHFLQTAAKESQPALMQIVAQAENHGVTWMLDDDTLTLGYGVHSRSYPRHKLPQLNEIEWKARRGIPLALITGSNGKTTTTRLLSAMLRAQGLVSGHNCTDGVYVGGELIEAGDYSGPAGARAVLAHPQVEAAAIETARGGLLRRGLAASQADAAIVTNIAEDHFGEYGINSLLDLARAKLVVARGLKADGVLVLNADDASLREMSAQQAQRQAWFALDYDHTTLQRCRAQKQSCCGVRTGVLLLFDGHSEHELGAVMTMPLTVQGSAQYNIANICGAALLAQLLHVALPHIAQVLQHFGRTRFDNPGRLERWDINGSTLLMDYAHNPEGLSGLLQIARHLRSGRGRLGLLLGQAGNREDKDIRALAAAAAEAQPDFIVIKELDSYRRGRAPGEVPQLLHDELLARGYPMQAVSVVLSEWEAVQSIVTMARPGDVLALAVHDLQSRQAAAQWFDELAQRRPTP